MKILFLGSNNEEFIKKLNNSGDEFRFEEKKLKENDNLLKWADFILVYSYRFIISEKIIKKFKKKIINLHISYLPWNRGADPNIWSIIENTPKGVSIHYIDAGIDTGPIIIQKKVDISLDETLQEGYEKLQYNIQNLLVENWSEIKKGRIKSKKQTEKGTNHFSKQAIELKKNLIDGWKTTGKELIQIYLKLMEKNV